ncbi:MAG: lipopolysaccharide kinase InaA family protein [Planctomycetota bacterium]
MGSTFNATLADRAWLERAGLGDVGAVMRLTASTVAAIGTSSETFAVDLSHIPSAPKTVFIKRYRYRGWKAKLGQLFRGSWGGRSRARFEFEFLEEMRRRGVAAVRPVAYGESRGRGWLREAVLLTEGQEGCTSLDLWLLDRRTGARSDSGRDRLFAALAAATRIMHELGVFHGGLFGRNMLVRDDGESWRVILLDPDRRGRLHAGPVPADSAVSDLAYLAATAHRLVRRTDQLRFLRRYLDQCTKRSDAASRVVGGAAGTESSTRGDAPFDRPTRPSRLDAQGKRFARDIAAAARPRLKQEAHRQAIAAAIRWLQRRTTQDRVRGAAAKPSSDVTTFFERLRGDVSSASPAVKIPAGVDGRVHLRVGDDRAGGSAEQWTLVLHGGRVDVRDGHHGRADLVIASEATTWSALLTGGTVAFQALRAGRLRLRGDTTLLPTVLDVVSVVA